MDKHDRALRFMPVNRDKREICAQCEAFELIEKTYRQELNERSAALEEMETALRRARRDAEEHRKTCVLYLFVIGILVLIALPLMLGIQR